MVSMNGLTLNKWCSKLKDLSFSQPITILEQVTDVDEIGQDLISFDLKYTIK